MRLFFLLTLTISIIASQTVGAQNNTDPEPPEALAKMVSSGSQIFYLGQYEGMNGWALIRQGKPEFFYENKDRTAMVMGLMFNKAGEMVTMSQLTALYDRVGDDMYAVTGGALPKEYLGMDSNDDVKVEKAEVKKTEADDNRVLTPAEQMYVDLLASNWVTINQSGKYDIFAFIDPDCVHCKKFINSSEPFLTDDGLRIRVIPVGIQEVSLRKAAVLIASANPEERLKKLAAGDTSVLTAPETIDTKAAASNLGLMQKHGLDVTPVIVYKTGKGLIRMVRGAPQDIAGIIKDIKEN
jgi:protein-disulfide isomerase